VPEKNPFSGTEVSTSRPRRKGVEADLDYPQVNPAGQSRLVKPGFAPPVRAEGVSDALAELARAVNEDLSTPDHGPATERAYEHDWGDFIAFCGQHGLKSLPAAPRPWPCT